MRRSVVIVTVLALFAVGAAAVEQAPPVTPPEIATPPGATLLTEVNLSENDILGMIKQAIPAFAQSAAGAPGEVGAFLKNVDLNAFADAIAGVKFIRVMQFQLAPGTSPTAVPAFYEGQFTPEQGWSRVLYDTSMAPKGVVAIYSRSGQDFFGVAVDPKSRRAFAIRTIGFVDVPKLAAWAGRTVRFVAEMEQKQKAAAKKTVKPSPKTPTKKAPAKTRTRR